VRKRFISTLSRAVAITCISAQNISLGAPYLT